MDSTDRASTLAKALAGGGIIRLLRERNPDQLTEDLRDLGQEFADLGAAILTRVADVDYAASSRWQPLCCSSCAAHFLAALSRCDCTFRTTLRAIRVHPGA